jgi:hypothetical protein
MARVTELIDTECRELLGIAGTHIFSNLQHLRPDLDLLDVLQRREATPPGTPDRQAIARAACLDIALQRLQDIYSRPGSSATARSESSSSGEATSSGESDMKKLRSPDTKRWWSPAARMRRPLHQA